MAKVTERRQTKTTRSGKVAGPECVLENAAGQVLATRHKTASGLNVIELFDSFGVKLADLCCDEQKYTLTIAREAQFQLQCLNGVTVLEVMNGDDPDGPFAAEPSALDLLLSSWDS
jgi:hypothetical protein